MHHWFCACAKSKTSFPKCLNGRTLRIKALIGLRQSGSLSIEWIEATGFQPVRFSERMRGLPDFEAARRVKLQNPGDPS
jgi:hypothetical protein